MLKITDRKKDLIVTAGGKNIAPQPIENMVKASKFVLNAVMLGDKRKFPIMLVVPNLDRLKAWAAHKKLLAPDEGACSDCPKWKRRWTGRWEDPARSRAIRGAEEAAAPGQDFTIESGELTPKMSVKRRVVEQRYAEQIDRLYAE